MTLLFIKKYNIVKSIILLILYIIFTFLPISIKKNELDYPMFIIDEYKNYFDLIDTKKAFALFRNKNKIENIFILIIIFPFLKEEILITKRNPFYPFIKHIFNINDSKIIKICKNNKTYFSNKFKELLNYKWEILPNKNKTNYIRHIIYHYYPKECLILYEQSLNLNIRHYIEKNRQKMTYEKINILLSKNCYKNFL